MQFYHRIIKLSILINTQLNHFNPFQIDTSVNTQVFSLSKQQNQRLMMAVDQDINIKVLGQSFRLGKKIDQGAFGKIYKAVSLTKASAEYAVKMQSMRAEHPQLIYECKLYLSLHTDPTACDKGIPGVYQCGVQEEYNYMVMQLMGPSLQSLLSQCSRRFSLKTVLLLLDQMLTNIQYIQSRHYIHRDIKPDNYCMGAGKSKQYLYLLDFGLAKSYTLKNGKHIAYKEGKSLTGTARYASVRTHLGIQQSRRDDLQSIGYVMLYLLKGSLPWQGQKGGTKQDKYQRIKQTKINTTVESLCRNFPDQFRRYMNFVKALQFSEEPDYEKYRLMFRNLSKRCGYEYDYVYDWSLQQNNPRFL